MVEALGLVFGLFIYFTLIGWFATIPMRTYLVPFFRMAIAPTMGFSLHVLCLFLLSRLGFPMSHVATPVLACFAGLALVGLYQISLARDLSFSRYFLIILLAFMLTAWPMLKLGLNWLSFCNDDMGNYCMGGTGFRDYVLNDAMLAEQIPNAQDYSMMMWGLYTLSARIGCELTLGWVSALTGYQTLPLFMPLLVSFHLFIISAIIGVAYQSSRSRNVAFLTGIVAAVSPPLTYGVVLCLIAQTIGLAQLLVVVSLLCWDYASLSRMGAVVHGSVVGLMFAALLVTYTEVMPFVVLTFGFYAMFSFRSYAASFSKVLLAAVASLVTLGICLNTYIGLCFRYLAAQAGLSRYFVEKVEGPEFVLDPLVVIERFHYYYVPDGFAHLWGFLPVGATLYAGVVPSLLVALGALLVLLVAYLLLTTRRLRDPLFCLLLTMIVTSVVLYATTNAFGIYKLAMYMQIALIPFIVVGWNAAGPRFRAATLPILWPVLVLFGVSQYYFTSDSFGRIGSTSQVYFASLDGLPQRLASELPPGADSYWIDTSRSALMKFISLYTRGVDTQAPSSAYQLDFYPFWITPEACRKQFFNGTFQRMQTSLGQEFLFDLKDPNDDSLTDRFKTSLFKTGTGANAEYMFVSGYHSGFLNRHHIPVNDQAFTLLDRGSVNNHLMYVPSDLGRSEIETSRSIAFFNCEQDTFYPKRSFAAAGRHILSMVYRPTEAFRCKIDLTSSIQPPIDFVLPSVDVVGDSRVSLGIKGHGSARMYSEPLSAQMIRGNGYVGIDMNRDPVLFVNRLSGFQTLFGNDVRRDRRAVAAFIRDFSLLTEKQFEDLVPPTRLSKFPEDLLDNNLEYYGFYEDGWSSDATMFRLSRPAKRASLSFSATVPLIDDPDFTTDMVISVDGKPVHSRTLPVGEFALEIPIPDTNLPSSRFELSFSKVQRLPGGDNRPVGIKVGSIGFQAPEKFNFEDLAVFSNLGGQLSGLSVDGWAGSKASWLIQPKGPAKAVVCNGVVPNLGKEDFACDVEAFVDGQSVLKKRLPVGEFQLEIPLNHRNEQIHQVDLQFSATQRLSAADPREVALRLLRISTVP